MIKRQTLLWEIEIKELNRSNLYAKSLIWAKKVSLICPKYIILFSNFSVINQSTFFPKQKEMPFFHFRPKQRRMGKKSKAAMLVSKSCYKQAFKVLWSAKGARRPMMDFLSNQLKVEVRPGHRFHSLSIIHEQNRDTDAISLI